MFIIPYCIEWCMGEPQGNGPLTIAELRDELQTLTATQRDILRFLSDGRARSGAEVKDEMDPFYGGLNNGVLYPSLDRLTGAGLISRGQRDRRTNSYEITDKGVRFITYVNEELGGTHAGTDTDEASDADVANAYEVTD